MDKNTLEYYVHFDRLLEKLLTRYHSINICQY